MSTPVELGLPPLPPESLDPCLDAASRCFVRYGVRRTRIQDVADELGVNRVTVYRQVGPLRELTALLVSRELHRLVVSVLGEIADPLDASALVSMLTAGIRAARAHPVLAKVLADEPELLAPLAVAGMPHLLDRVVPAVLGLIQLANSEGSLSVDHPPVVADVVVRLAVSLVVTPPGGDLEAYLSVVLPPILGATSPTGRSATRSTRRR